jgi:hypothetical protein
MESRHPGLTSGLADHQCDAAGVCLARFHALPPSVLSVQAPARDRKYELIWRFPASVQLAANANEDDATEAGAYAVGLACVDAHLGLVTVGRTYRRSGADWHLRPYPVVEHPFDIDRDDVVRLEVSGVSDDNDTKIRERVRVKRAQAAARPGAALVAVVGFRSPRVVIRNV